MKIFAPPLKWDKAIDGPDSVASSRWLQEFERSQLPTDAIFPKPGQVWQARRDCVVGVVAIMELKDSNPAGKIDLKDGGIVAAISCSGFQ